MILITTLLTINRTQTLYQACHKFETHSCVNVAEYHLERQKEQEPSCQVDEKDDG